MSVYYADATVTVHRGDCLDVLRTLPDGSVDSVVTDPPYGLGFMGKAWDAEFISGTIEKRRQYAGDPSPKAGENGGYRSAAAEAGRYDQSLTGNRGFGEWCEAWAVECLRVLKPGGHMLAFGGTRTFHRLACAVEDAGFEVRDSIAWMYGSGFPKSLDVSKAIDKAAGAEREVVGHQKNWGASKAVDGKQAYGDYAGGWDTTAPATPDAEKWQGWGTALKPAFEPIVVARKPLVGTVASNVLAHGTGALNVDGCRVGDGGGTFKASKPEGTSNGIYGHGINGTVEIGALNAGRWPANVVLDESQAAALDEQSGELVSGKMRPTHTDASREVFGQNAAGGFTTMETYGDSGGASRFFYVAKADASERVRINGTAHPTVKPLELMRWLVRLVTPPGGTVLEPFAGSGTTVEACLLEGFQCIAIEREADYLPLIRQRIDRRRDPVAAVKASAEDGGLFDLLDGGAA